MCHDLGPLYKAAIQVTNGSVLNYTAAQTHPTDTSHVSRFQPILLSSGTVELIHECNFTHTKNNVLFKKKKWNLSFLTSNRANGKSNFPDTSLVCVEQKNFGGGGGIARGLKRVCSLKLIENHRVEPASNGNQLLFSTADRES